MGTEHCLRSVMLLPHGYLFHIALATTFLLTMLLRSTYSFGRLNIIAESFGKRNVKATTTTNIQRSSSSSSSSASTDSSRAATADAQHMRLALRHAQFAFREKEVPIGAVLVHDDGTVLAAARNSVERTKDASAHAEMTCLRKAASLGDSGRLNNCTLYTTLEPCPMCMGALQSFRVRRVVFGAKDPRLGAAGSFVDLAGGVTHPFHTLSVTGGVLEEESSTLLKRFFRLRRAEADGTPSIDED